MIDILSWLLAVELLGILALPICLVLFRRLPDRGITLAKPLALVLFSYVLWVFGLTHVIPNSRVTIVIILVLGAVAGLLLVRGHAAAIREFLRKEWRTLAVAEALFLGFFFLWLGVISEAAAINHTEKPMDFGFMNAVLQSRYFPPEDPWLSGHSISYYYFGHFMMAFLAKLAAVPSSVGYNLAVALAPAMLASACFGVVYNLVRLSGGARRVALGFAAAAPVLIIMAGSLQGVLEFVNAQGWGGSGFWEWAGIKGLEETPGGVGAYPDQSWWWWRATRVIDTLRDGQSLDYTITEFPMFSYLLGDLHPHVVSLPFLVLGLSLGLNLFLSPARLGFSWLRRHPWEFLAIALFTGALGFINAWDLPMMAGLLVVLALVKGCWDYGGSLRAAAANSAAVVAPALALGVALFLPFYLTVSGQASGIVPLMEVSTRPFLFLLVMGLFSVLAIPFILRQLPRPVRPAATEAPAARLALAITLAPLAVWVLAVIGLSAAGHGASPGQLAARMALVLPGLALVGAAGYGAALKLRRDNDAGVSFPLLLAAVGFYLLVGAELFYVADVFGNRMNTVFKFYYQAWLLLGLAGVYGGYHWWSRRSRTGGATEAGMAWRRAARLGNLAWMSGVALLVAASAYYTVGAVLDRTGLMREDHTLADNTVDGLAFVRESDPGEYAAITWLRDEAPWGRIVEAVGDDYSDFGRVSASTGLPTLLGWRGHEVQWRGGSDVYDQRARDVARIYRGGSEGAVRPLLEAYGVRYVYVGKRERARYGTQGLAALDGFLETAFDWHGVKIYELAGGG